jgi:hypothetical protein
MHFILTTDTAVEKIRLNAKAIRKAQKVPHMEALELAAIGAGYTSWYHVKHCVAELDKAPTSGGPSIVPVKEMLVTKAKSSMAYFLSKRSTAPIENAAKGKIFRDVVIEGMQFKGFVGPSGPSLMNVSPNHPTDEQVVRLGAAEIHFCPPQEPTPWQARIDEAWWICKYGTDEPRININSLTEAGRLSLAYEFGIAVLPDPESLANNAPKLRYPIGNSDRLFYLSPAFESLWKWANSHQSHRRLIRSKEIGDSYLPGWKDAAITGEYERCGVKLI